MPKYYVRTNSDRVICIEADSYYDTGSFLDFKKNSKVAASFHNHAVLGVFDEKVYQGEFSALGEDTDDLLDSDEFFDRVVGIVDSYLAPDEYPTPASPVEEYPIEHWKKNDKEWWGFQTKKGFIYFTSRIAADATRDSVIQHVDDWNWGYLDLTGYTKVED